MVVKKMENTKKLYLERLPREIIESSLFMVFADEKLLVKKCGTGFEFIKFSDISGSINIKKISGIHFIGINNKTAHYCFRAENLFKTESVELEFHDLRALMPLLDQSQFTMAGKAAQVLYWDKTTKFCGECGRKTKHSESERAKICPECGRHYYPAVTPAIIVAVMKGDKILLAHNKNFADGVYSLIAGFVEPGESLEECVKREVGEETGIEVFNVKYFQSQPWPFPSSMMIGFTASYKNGEIKPDGEEIIHADWFDSSNMPNLPRPGSLSRKLIDAFTADPTKLNS